MNDKASETIEFIDEMTDMLFSNIGTKIKRHAKYVSISGMVLSIVFGLYFCFEGFAKSQWLPIIQGFLIAGLGAGGSWIGAFAFYGFGELIENSCIQTELLLRMEKRNRE